MHRNSELDAVVEHRRRLETAIPTLTFIFMDRTGQSYDEERIFEYINQTLENTNVFIFTPAVESDVDIRIPINKIYIDISSKCD